MPGTWLGQLLTTYCFCTCSEGVTSLVPETGFFLPNRQSYTADMRVSAAREVCLKEKPGLLTPLGIVYAYIAWGQMRGGGGSCIGRPRGRGRELRVRRARVIAGFPHLRYNTAIDVRF